MTQPNERSREEKIQALHELIASAKRRDVSGVMVQVSDALLLLEEINRLRQERKVNDDKVNELLQLDKQMKSEIEEVKKVSFELAGEVSQLREDKQKLIDALKDISDLGTTSNYTANVAVLTAREALRALGIGVDNETSN